MKTLLGLVVAVLSAFSAVSARAEVFQLVNEGQVRGEWLNKDEMPRKKYVIRTEDGSELTLDKKQVAKVIHEKPDLREYERIRGDYADTVDGQWEISEWCREHKLIEERKVHLERILELEPDNADARRILGYHKIDGRWVTQEQIMTQRGYKSHKGKWLLPQEIEMEEEKNRVKSAQVDWTKKIKRWTDGMNRGDKVAEAEHGLASIDDPLAVSPIEEMLKKEKDEHLRTLLIESLGRIGTPKAQVILVHYALHDDNHDVWLAAVDELEKLKHPDVTGALVSGLKDKKNTVINRAGLALGKIGDPSAIRPLIDALVTKHRVQVSPGNNGQMGAAFGGTSGNGGGGGGGGGLTMGGGPSFVEQTLRNESVRDALVAITDQNFDFDVATWQKWYAGQRKFRGVNARRD